MNEPDGSAHPNKLRVLIATQSANTGAALASLLGDPCDISYQIVTLSHVLPLDHLHTVADGLDVVLLDLEPWPAKALGTGSTSLGRAAPLVLALAHGVGESMRRQCRDTGVDYLLDRTADLGRLQGVISDYIETRRTTAQQIQAAP